MSHCPVDPGHHSRGLFFRFFCFFFLFLRNFALPDPGHHSLEYFGFHHHHHPSNLQPLERFQTNEEETRVYAFICFVPVSQGEAWSHDHFPPKPKEVRQEMEVQLLTQN